MSAEPNAVQVVRDYAGANNEIIKIEEIALSIAEAARVCGYCWSTLCFLTCRLMHMILIAGRSSPCSSPFAALHFQTSRIVDGYVTIG